MAGQRSARILGHGRLVQGRAHEADAMTRRTVSITEETLFTALRAFLVDVLPSDMEIVQGQDNGVPMPSAENFVILTAADRAQLAGTVTQYEPDDGAKEVSRSTRFDYQ